MLVRFASPSTGSSSFCKIFGELKHRASEKGRPLQKAFPSMDFPDLGSCNLLRSFLNKQLNFVVELDADKGDIFLEGFLINGWLPKLAFLCGHVEKLCYIHQKKSSKSLPLTFGMQSSLLEKRFRHWRTTSKY